MWNRLGLVLGAVMLFTGGCTEVIRMDPMVFQATDGPDGLQVNTMDPEALFQEGKSAFRAQKYDESAHIFTLFLKHFPEDSRASNARYNAGLSLERLEEWDAAKFHFLAYTGGAKDVRDQIDGHFRLVICFRGLRDWGGMKDRLDILRKLALTPLDRAEVLALTGYAYEMQGHMALAERSYLKALELEREQEDPQLFKSNEHLAMAQYQIGEIYRRLFDAIAFRLPVERMQRDLHDKSTLFLKAQSAYLRTIRRQQKSWAFAAGFRTGEIYEAFYQDFLKSEVPSELDNEEVQIYFEELRDQIRPLLERAIRIYERNIKMGARSRQGDNPWIEKTRSHLERLKSLLAEEMERMEREKKEEDAQPKS